MRKIFFVVLASLFLSGCFQLVALVPSVITGVTTGNALQAGLSYGFSYGVREKTGMTPMEHIVNHVGFSMAMAVNAGKKIKTVRNDDLFSSFAPK